MKTGVIGLGAMGSAMALNLHKAGHLHRVWNRTSAKAWQLSEQTGAAAAGSIEELAAACELIIVSVSRDNDVLAVIEKIATAIRPGSIVVDTSTVSNATARQAAGMIKAKHGDFLDCPVTGGVEGARNGTLSLMAGGDAAVLERIRPVLTAIAKKIVHIGPTGSGQACKAVNQIICAGINQAVTEGLAFGEVMGLDMDKVLEAIAGGAAGNWFMDHRGRSMLAGRYQAGFKLNLHLKDLKICMDMASQNRDTSLPLTAMTAADYEKLLAQGHGDEDISALYRLKAPVNPNK
jgi:3-hydroxyisobutyrate dehydrogenase